MMIRLGRIKPAVFSFPLERHKQQQFALRPQHPAHFQQRRRRLQDMLQRVMTNHRVHRGAGQCFGVGDKFDPLRADRGCQKILQIEGQSAPA